MMPTLDSMGFPYTCRGDKDVLGSHQGVERRGRESLIERRQERVEAGVRAL